MSANNGHWMSGGNASFETNKSAESVQHPHQVASAPSGLKWVRIVNQIKRHIWMMKTLIFQCSIVCLQRCSRVDSIFFSTTFNLLRSSWYKSHSRSQQFDAHKFFTYFTYSARERVMCCMMLEQVADATLSRMGETIISDGFMARCCETMFNAEKNV